VASLRRIRLILLASLLGAGADVPRATAAAPTEQQVKAVFLFNFSSFVDWPADAFASPAQPFTFCLLGGDALAAHLEEAINGENVEGRPMLLRQLVTPVEAAGCQILFIGSAQAARVAETLAALRGRRTLTVSDLEGAARRGVMIQLFNESNRIRLAINVDEARRAGLVISSNLLRPAQIVRTEAPEAP
jgi:hypothetical protein